MKLGLKKQFAQQRLNSRLTKKKPAPMQEAGGK